MKSSQIFYTPKLKSGLLATVALSAAAITTAVFTGLLLATENYLVIGLLSALGFGLDLEECAITGANDGLTHVSPKTGRAVRGSEAEQYVDRLLALPDFLMRPAAALQPGDIAAGLKLTGHFLENRLFAAVHRGVPPERERLVLRLLSKA